MTAAKTDLIIKPVTGPEFKRYGRVLPVSDEFFEAICATRIPLPESGVAYTASSPKLESISGLRELLEREYYAGMPCQIGFVSGFNQKLNGFEWHQGAEIQLPLDPMILILGRLEDLEEDENGMPYYESKLVEAFRVEAGQAVLLNDETLHLAPVSVTRSGFRSACVLPRGTNEAFADDEKRPVNPLIVARNKWFISHPELGEGVPAIRGANPEIPLKD